MSRDKFQGSGKAVQGNVGKIGKLKEVRCDLTPLSPNRYTVYIVH